MGSLVKSGGLMGSSGGDATVAPQRELEPEKFFWQEESQCSAVTPQKPAEEHDKQCDQLPVGNIK
jgi:hypothetical protein